MNFVVAIDGPAAAGKGTIAKAVANHFGFSHLDSGLLYRAVAAKTLKGADPVAASEALHEDDLKANNLRSPEVAQMASKVAALEDVRLALIDFQHSFAQQDGGAVIDGRDIGTVRSISTSLAIRSAPGRVDSPPTSGRRPRLDDPTKSLDAR